QIELAIAVVIQPAGGRGPFAGADAGLDGDVFESTVAQIMVERVAIDAGDEEVRAPVVIVVGGRRAHRVSGACHAGLRGNVAKLQVAFVVVQPVPILGG